MPVAETRIPTPKASRFLVQLCRHAEAMGGRAQHLHAGVAGEIRPEVVRVEWTDADGRIQFDWGDCVLRSTSDELMIRVEVDGDDRLQWIRDLLTADLERFGRRDGLKVSWEGAEAPPRPAPRGGRSTKIAVIAAVVLAVLAHLVAGTAALSSWGWTSVAADILLAAIVLKIVVVTILTRRRFRNRGGFAAHSHRQLFPEKDGAPK